MKYTTVFSTSYRQFDELIQKEMDIVGKKRRVMYQSLYESVKHNEENVDVIRMKQLIEEGDDTEILKLVPILLRVKKELES
jgi:hypothetical protein